MLKAKLQADQLMALRKGEREKLETLRYILAQIKNKEIEKQKELADEEVVAQLRKVLHELEDTIVVFEKGGRADLVEKNKTQIAVISQYLPAQLDNKELSLEIQKIINDNKEVVEKNPKALLGIAVSKLKDKADPARIVQTTNQLLSS